MPRRTTRRKSAFLARSDKIARVATTQRVALSRFVRPRSATRLSATTSVFFSPAIVPFLRADLPPVFLGSISVSVSVTERDLAREKEKINTRRARGHKASPRRGNYVEPARIMHPRPRHAVAKPPSVLRAPACNNKAPLLYDDTLKTASRAHS